MTSDQLQLLQQQLSAARSILVLFPENASVDEVLSAVTFGQGLQSMGRGVSVASLMPMPDSLKNFSGVPEIAKTLEGKNLQVIFPYKPEQVDKVSYHIDEQKQTFNLVVQPQKGQDPLSEENVEFQYSGMDTDVIVLFNVPSWESVDGLVGKYLDSIQSLPVIHFSRVEAVIGTLKLDITPAASFAEVCAYVLQELGVAISGEMATNLLAGIEQATDSFRSMATTAESLEIASKLLRLGARRMRLPSSLPPRIGSVPTWGASQPRSSSQFRPLVLPKEAGSFAEAIKSLQQQTGQVTPEAVVSKKDSKTQESASPAVKTHRRGRPKSQHKKEKSTGKNS